MTSSNATETNDQTVSAKMPEMSQRKKTASVCCWGCRVAWHTRHVCGIISTREGGPIWESAQQSGAVVTESRDHQLNTVCIPLRSPKQGRGQ